MNARISASMCVAGAIALGMVVSAQGQQQTPPPQAQQADPSMGQQVTVTGCIEREADFRRARDAGRGGVAGTGFGVGNEFILSHASMSPSGTSAAPTGTEPPTPTGTSGASPVEAAYELTGPNENQVESYVGRRVEISGRLKPGETGAGGEPTGGATAGAPPKGVDATSKDLKLREIEVSSVREVPGGSCPAGK